MQRIHTTRRKATPTLPCALKKNADKTGGTDSSPLFAAIRTAYETLATSRGRALHKAVPAGGGGGGGGFGWAVEVGVASARVDPGAGGVPGTAGSQGSASGVSPAKEERPRRWAPRKETQTVNSSGSSDVFLDEAGCGRRSAAAGFQEAAPGVSRQGQREGGGHGPREREGPGRSDGNKERQRQETGHAQNCAGIGIVGQGGVGDAEGRADLHAESDTGTPTEAPRQANGREKKQYPDQERAGDTHTGEEEKDDRVVGLEVGRQVSVGAERLSKAFRPSDSSPAAPFAGDGGAHQPPPPYTGRQQPRKQLDDQSDEGNGGVGAHRVLPTTVPLRDGSPLLLPSEIAVARAALSARTSTQPPSEKAAVVSDPGAGGIPSVAASASGSLGVRNRVEGERTVESSLFHGLFRDQGLETSSSPGDDTSSSGDSGGGESACNGGGGGCVQRLRQRVTTRGHEQYHNATACTSPVSGALPE